MLMHLWRVYRSTHPGATNHILFLPSLIIMSLLTKTNPIFFFLFCGLFIHFNRWPLIIAHYHNNMTRAILLHNDDFTFGTFSALHNIWIFFTCNGIFLQYISNTPVQHYNSATHTLKSNVFKAWLVILMWRQELIFFSGMKLNIHWLLIISANIAQVLSVGMHSQEVSFGQQRFKALSKKEIAPCSCSITFCTLQINISWA